jgi:hypothetical protein
MPHALERDAAITIEPSDTPATSGTIGSSFPKGGGAFSSENAPLPSGESTYAIVRRTTPRSLWFTMTGEPALGPRSKSKLGKPERRAGIQTFEKFCHVWPPFEL